MTLKARRGPPHAKPISWQPSEHWDGADGNWSTFPLRVGQPEKVVRVLPCSAGGVAWVVSTDGCQPGERGIGPTSTCADSRGDLFNISSSKTWKDTGFYAMGLELNLGFNDTADYGLDAVALGLSNHTGGPYLDSQIVGVFASESYHVGMFGLSHQPNNLSNFETSYPSFLSTLKSRKMIPSLSWAYTAGARYKSKPVFGSLTLGGYDASQIIPNNVSFYLAPDVSRDLVVVLDSIKATYANGSVMPLLHYGIATYIDSTIPYLYLPIDVCDIFEKQFGLRWNATLQTYLVDEDVHTNLLAADFSITFSVSNSQSNKGTVDIVLPYASFDLTLEYPLISHSHRYFPLKRASNESQYTLGRTFLQEAYIITNYEESNFSVYQTNFDEGAKTRLVTIPAADTETQSQGVSRATKIGVSVGSALFVLLTLLAAAMAWKKWGCCHKGRREQRGRRMRARTKSRDLCSPVEPINIGEIDNNSLIGMYRELPDSGKAELQDETSPSGSGQDISELSPATTRSIREASRALSHVPTAYELRTHCSTNVASRAQSRGAEEKLAIVVSTNMSRMSWTTADTSTTTDMPCVETIICSSKSSEADLNRSLPSTPISESLQVSPIVSSFHNTLATRRGFERVLGGANIPRYAIGSIGYITPRNRSVRDLAHREKSYWSGCSMEMEVVVPPELSEAEVIIPLNVYRKEGRQCQSVF